MTLSRIGALDCVAFFLGCLSPFYVNLVGRFHLAEMCAPIAIWGARGRLRVLKWRPIAGVMLLGIAWLLGQVASDLYRGTPTQNLLRGWSSIFVFLLLIATLATLLVNNVRRTYLALFGMATGGLLLPLIEPSPYFDADPWKFGYGPPVAVLLVSWIGWNCRPEAKCARLYFVSVAALGMFSIFDHARSLGGFLVLTAIVMWLRQTRVGVKLSRSKVKLAHILALSLVVCVGALFVLRGYEFAAGHDWLGARAEQKYFSDEGNWGLIIGGRAEVISGVHAVLDSPLIGYGSWARDPGFKFRRYLTSLSQYGYRQPSELDEYMTQLDLIPTHSTLLQAWVWSGILGAIFCAYILVLMVRTGVYLVSWENELFVPSTLLLIWRSWDLFFSPFGSDMRFEWAISIIIFVNIIHFSGSKRPQGKIVVRRSVI